MGASLSGDLTSKDGKRVVVSLIFNEFGGNSGDVREIADDFVKKLTAANPKGTPLAERTKA